MAGSGAGMMSGVIIGSFLCIGLLLLAVTATIVLSLISIYTSNNSQNGWGDEYQINNILLKLLHANATYVFNNGSVADASEIGTFCSSYYVANGATKFAGCVADNFYVEGPYNSSTTSKRRRRAATGTTGSLAYGRLRLFYSNRCTKSSDEFKYANSSKVSQCVLQRLDLCNKVFYSQTSQLTAAWFTSFLLSIFDSISSSYVPLTITEILTYPKSIGLSVASALGVPQSAMNDYDYGCQYIGPRSQDYIAAVLATQYTTTAATTSAIPSSG